MLQARILRGQKENDYLHSSEWRSGKSAQVRAVEPLRTPSVKIGWQAGIPVKLEHARNLSLGDASFAQWGDCFQREEVSLGDLERIGLAISFEDLALEEELVNMKEVQRFVPLPGPVVEGQQTGRLDAI